MFTKALGKYNYLLKNYPVATNSTTAGILFFLGDVICQKVDNLVSKTTYSYDIKRSLRVSSFGFFFIGPFGYHWYRLADKFFPTTSFRDVSFKLLAEFTTFSPVYIPLFFIYQDMLNGKSLDSIKVNLKDKFWHTYLVDIIYWIPVEVINFALLSPQYRILYISTMSIGWNTFLSWKQHK